MLLKIISFIKTIKSLTQQKWLKSLLEIGKFAREQSAALQRKGTYAFWQRGRERERAGCSAWFACIPEREWMRIEWTVKESYCCSHDWAFPSLFPPPSLPPSLTSSPSFLPSSFVPLSHPLFGIWACFLFSDFLIILQVCRDNLFLSHEQM